MALDFAAFQRDLIFLLTCCSILVTSVPKHPVILVPGILGSPLWQQSDKNGDFTHLWVCPWKVICINDLFSKLTLKFDNQTGKTSNNRPSDVIQPCGFGDPYSLTDIFSNFHWFRCDSKSQDACKGVTKTTYNKDKIDKMGFWAEFDKNEYWTERLLQNIEEQMNRIKHEKWRTCDMEEKRTNGGECLKTSRDEGIDDVLSHVAVLRHKLNRPVSVDDSSHSELLGPSDWLLTILQRVAEISCIDKNNTPASTECFFPRELFDAALRVYGHQGKPHFLFKYVPDREERVAKLAKTAAQMTCSRKLGTACTIPDTAYTTAQQTYLSKDPLVSLLEAIDYIKFGLRLYKIKVYKSSTTTALECDMLLHYLEIILKHLPFAIKVSERITEFLSMVEKLKENGFTPNRNLLGAPYDFRRAPYELTDFYNNMKKLIEETSSANDNSPVVVVAHSMGNLVMRHFYNNVTSPEWRDRYIKAHVALGAPWAGAVNALEAIIIGEDFNSPISDREAVRAAARSWPSITWLLPQADVWDTPLVMSPLRNYTVRDYQTLFADLPLPYPEGYDMLRWIKRNIGDVEVVPQVKEVHVLYGTEVDTPHHIVLQPDVDPEHVVQVKGGDGTVNLRSLEYLKDKNHPGINLTHQSFAGVDHVGILSDHRVLDFIVGLVTEGERPYNEY